MDPAASKEPVHEIGRTPGKFGAKPYKAKPSDFKFNTFATTTLPQAKVGYQHDRWTKGWLMLGNDDIGNCVPAGRAHETMIFGHSGGKTITFNTACVTEDYSTVTGYVPGDPNTDQGTDPGEYASFSRKVGVLDAEGNRHKIAAFAYLEPGNWHQMLQGLYVGEAIAFCFNVPESAMDQFSDGMRWSYVGDKNIIGGHYVMTGARPGVSVGESITWGQRQQFTRKFFETYNDIGIVYFSEEMLKNGKSLEGLDVQGIENALAQL